MLPLLILLTLVILLVGLWIIGERGRLLRPSTRKLIREMGWRRVLKLDFLHAYIYGRWTRLYIGGSIRYYFPLLKPFQGRRRWADVYHGKILTPELAQALITVNEPIPLQDLEQIIPYRTARDLVLQAPLEIAVYECACRHARANPCQPTQVCMIIGQPFVDFVLEHHPQTSRRLTQAEALDLLRAEHARGHLHAAYLKDVMLNRFYAICNCCKCCCGGIEAMNRLGVPMIASSGYVAQVDDPLCNACGTCETACPFGAITVNGSAQIAWEVCMGCGVCEGQCPNGAIRLARDERKGPPLDVRALA
jgi:ferredoxin